MRWIALLLLLSTHTAFGQTEVDKPALVVVIAVDQLRRDRMDAGFPGGIGKLLTGRQYINSQLDHGITNTCPGHVVLLTGANPATAGVPGNSFIDRETYESRYCVDDADPVNTVLHGEGMRSPGNIRVTALGDWLKASNPASRVFSVGGKDRSTIAMGGQRPDGAYWYSRDTGKFTTSGYYTSELPDYLTTFNGEAPESDGYLAALPTRWEHPASDFRPDDYEGESEDFLRVSGHPIRSGEDIYQQVYHSPYLDQQTLELARLVVREEQLGRRGATDLLAIALSATDTVGHRYGPRSAEGVDALAKVDSWLGVFLAELEAELGTDNILVAFSADHGVAELPEYMTEQGRNSCPEQGRLSVTSFITALYWNVYLEFTFPFTRPDNLVVFGGSSFTINKEVAEELGVDPDEVALWLDQYFSRLPIVEQAWTRAEVQNGKTEIARLLRNSLVDDRSGDVMVQLKRDCVLHPGGGTTHGSVYAYDRDVPMVYYGWQIAPGRIGGLAHTVDMGPSLAAHLGIAIPADLDGRVLPLAEQVINSDNQ
jgi:predicted AlkP superfamily pyrophosphatase or phosphodiesterase